VNSESWERPCPHMEGSELLCRSRRISSCALFLLVYMFDARCPVDHPRRRLHTASALCSCCRVLRVFIVQLSLFFRRPLPILPVLALFSLILPLISAPAQTRPCSVQLSAACTRAPPVSCSCFAASSCSGLNGANIATAS
jgi:hypothetical protein